MKVQLILDGKEVAEAVLMFGTSSMLSDFFNESIIPDFDSITLKNGKVLQGDDIVNILDILNLSESRDEEQLAYYGKHIESGILTFDVDNFDECKPK